MDDPVPIVDDSSPAVDPPTMDPSAADRLSMDTMTSPTAPRRAMPPWRFALVAHDHRKQDLLDWAGYNRDLLSQHELMATGTTGRMLADGLGLPVECLNSGPLGGDLQIGSRITEGLVDFLVFFWDPLEPQPHDPDVKALLRIAVVWNLPVASNRASADFMVSSPLLDSGYRPDVPTYPGHPAPFTQQPPGAT